MVREFCTLIRRRLSWPIVPPVSTCSAVDDATRLAYVAHVPNECAASASRALLDAAVWFAERGVRIELVMAGLRNGPLVLVPSTSLP